MLGQQWTHHGATPRCFILVIYQWSFNLPVSGNWNTSLFDSKQHANLAGVTRTLVSVDPRIHVGDEGKIILDNNISLQGWRGTVTIDTIKLNFINGYHKLFIRADSEASR